LLRQSSAFAAAFNLAETNEEKIHALEYFVEAAKFSEQVANARKYITNGHETAKFWRLNAEINLLSFKKDPSIFQFKVDMSPATKLRGSHEIVAEPANDPDCKKTVHHAENRMASKQFEILDEP
jgi:hypothetical protein